MDSLTMLTTQLHHFLGELDQDWRATARKEGDPRVAADMFVASRAPQVRRYLDESFAHLTDALEAAEPEVLARAAAEHRLLRPASAAAVWTSRSATPGTSAAVLDGAHLRLGGGPPVGRGLRGAPRGHLDAHDAAHGRTRFGG